LKKALILTLILFSCSKPDDCLRIIDKVSTNNNYYFISSGSMLLYKNDTPGTQIEVSQEIYSDYSIGDKYCKV